VVLVVEVEVLMQMALLMMDLAEVEEEEAPCSFILKELLMLMVQLKRLGEMEGIMQVLVVEKAVQVLEEESSFKE
jgi:hypothetical protein